MSLYVLLLVLTAAILHASWNVLAKKAKGNVPFIWLQYVASNLLYLPFLFFPHTGSGWSFSLPLLWFSLSSGLLHLGYFVVLQKGYRNADLSVVYPLARGSGPLFSSLAAILFLHEPLKATSTIGLFLIIAGVIIITGLKFRAADNKHMMKGVSYGLLTGFFIALYTLNDTIAVKSYGLSPLLLTLATQFFSAALLFPFIAGKFSEVRHEWALRKRTIVAIAVLSPAAYILVLEALQHAPLTVVAPARESSILIGVFMGSAMLKEKDGRRRLIASVLILAGIVALTLS